MARSIKSYTRIPVDERMFRVFLSRGISVGETIQRPERGTLDDEFKVSKRMFEKAAKDLKRKIGNLPPKKVRNAAFFYVETSGKYVADALKLSCEGIYVDNKSVQVPTQTLRHLHFQKNRGEEEINIVVIDDIYDSGETAVKIAAAFSSYFRKKGILVRITFAAALRRRQEYERNSYGFSTFDFNTIPHCHLLYGKRAHSMKYFSMPWERKAR